MSITAVQLLAGYAERSGVTLEQVLADGRIVATCCCDHESCEGWQVTRPEYLLPWRGEETGLARLQEHVDESVSAALSSFDGRNFITTDLAPHLEATRAAVESLIRDEHNPVEP